MMTSSLHIQASQDPLIYFGKLPSRGDFVRSNSGGAVIQTLDRWITTSLEQLAVAPNWKQQFDAMASVEFVFLGSRSTSVLTGRIVGSRDSSGRRFPFMIAGSLRTETPLALLRVLPLCLLPAWTEMDLLTRNAIEASQIEDAIDRIDLAHLQVESDLSAIEFSLDGYFASATIGNTQRLLAASGNALNLRQSIIALGLLLSPMLTHGAGAASKGLALPLPGTTSAAAHIAAFWLSLIAPFLARGDFDLNLMRAHLDGRPHLLLGFNGASPRALESILNPQLAFDANIDLCQAEWTEDYIAGEYPLSKLSSYLEHPDLSLAQALNTFSEVFLGA